MKDIPIAFIDDDGTTYESENFVDFKLKEKDQEIERLQDKILKLETDVSIYKDLSNLRKDRINKAIEFIETFNKTIKNDKRFGGDVDFMTIPKDLLKIFEGSDKE